jgi:Restriction endonuclease
MGDARYDELMRQFEDLAASLPPIHEYAITVRPMHLDEAGQWRIDAMDVPEALPGLQRELDAPGKAIAEYRHRLQKERRGLVRQRAEFLATQIDGLLSDLVERHPRDSSSVKDDEDWITMDKTFRELFRLLGKDELRGTRISYLERHLHFGLGVDLHDIADHDWPDVKPRIEKALYADREPLPVPMVDLGTLAAARPAGPVPTELDFSGLDDETFERLIFSLLTTTEGYENATWLMETRAPDRGRDLSVDRVNADALTGVTRDRVIVQCKAWKKSLSPTECAAALAPLPLWQPPPIDVLVIATTGRFSADAVAWIEKHNNEGKRPRIQLWANSTLELMLASRSDLVTRFDLRP